MNEKQITIIDKIKKLDSAPVECDGFVRLVSRELDRWDQDYIIKCGVAKSEGGGVIGHHYWVEWGELLIDFRARMWLGDCAQHGVLKKSDVEHLYEGKTIQMQPVTDFLEQLLLTPFPDFNCCFK